MSNQVAILKEIDLQIENEIAQTLEIIKTGKPQSAEPSQSGAEDISGELMKKLWILKTEYSEAFHLVEDGDIDNSTSKLTSFERRVGEFDAEFPNTLLAVDMTRKIGDLKNKIQDQLETQWKNAVKLSDNALILPAGSELHEKALAPLSEFLTKLEHLLIEPLINFEIILNVKEGALFWNRQSEISLDALESNLNLLMSYVSQAAAPLSSLIPRRFGAHLLTQVIEKSIPQIYPNTADPSDFHQELVAKLVPLDSKLQPLWRNSPVFAPFASSLEERWPHIRQEYYLMQLRQIFSSPVTEESRSTIVTMKHVDQEQEQVDQKDDWDWDENDEANDEDQVDDSKIDDDIAATDDGSLIELWQSYSRELKDYSMFFTLYRALIPAAYGDNHLWIYQDTSSFLSHIGHEDSETKPLIQLREHHLHKFITSKLNKLENNLLPHLFTDQQASVFINLRDEIDGIAVLINEIGGSELRQVVLSPLIERIAVYIVEAIEQMSDIGDVESQQLAILITKLSIFGVYFEQVLLAVPSWNKLEMLKSILSSNLVAIRDLHSQHLLMDFSADELTTLVKALFVDSPKRKEIINEFHSF